MSATLSVLERRLYRQPLLPRRPIRRHVISPTIGRPLPFGRGATPVGHDKEWERFGVASAAPRAVSGNLVGVDPDVEEDLFEDLRVEDLVAVNGKRHAHPLIVAVDPAAPALADTYESAPFEDRDQPDRRYSR